MRPISWHVLAEERIRDAQAAGLFDNLPGFGKPIAGIDEPYDEHWWIKDKLRREQLSLLPPALAIRLDVERTQQAMQRMTIEQDVRQAIESLNQRIHKAGFATSWGPSVNVLPLDAAQVLQAWRASRKP
jgi:hypothetical protein